MKPILLGEVKYETSLTVDLNDGKMCDWAAEYLEQTVSEQIESGLFVHNVVMREFDDRETVDPDDPEDRDMEHYLYNKKLQEDENEEEEVV